MSHIIFLTPELLSEILTCSVSHARKLLKQVRVKIGQPRSYRVSVRKFCEFHGYDEVDIYDAIKNIEERRGKKGNN